MSVHDPPRTLASTYAPLSAGGTTVSRGFGTLPSLKGRLNEA